MEENINVIEMNEVVGMTEIEEGSENSNGGAIVKALVIGGIAVGTAVVVYLNKTKEKRKAKKINNATEILRAEGYEIYKPMTELKEHTEDPDDIQE